MNAISSYMSDTNAMEIWTSKYEGVASLVQPDCGFARLTSMPPTSRLTDCGAKCRQLAITSILAIRIDSQDDSQGDSLGDSQGDSLAIGAAKDSERALKSSGCHFAVSYGCNNCRKNNCIKEMMPSSAALRHYCHRAMDDQ